METSTMRKMVDCRKMPSEMNCSVAISADNEEELLEAAVQHAVSVHGEKNTPHLREEIIASMENDKMS